MILVTGAAGFIGSHVVDRLLTDGHKVLGIDNFDPFYARGDKEANLQRARAHPRFTFAEADILDATSLEAAVRGVDSSIDVIVHLAAKAGVRPSIGDPLGFHHVNVTGTLHLLELARQNGVKQFVFGSSSSVYGVNPRVPWTEEDRDLQPISPYASSKLGAELHGQVYAKLFGIRFVGLRFFTVYGPRQRPDLAIAKFSRRILEQTPLPIFGDGSTRRDYTYVTDIADGVVRAIDYTDSPFEIINLGNHAPVSLQVLVNTLATTFGVEPRIERLPDQPGDVPQTWADISKARQLLGWWPHTTLADGIALFRDWLTEPDSCAARGHP